MVKLSKQMGQLYRVPLDEQGRREAMAGQFVQSNHDNDDYVLGFVNAVDREAGEMEICLFRPQQLPANVIEVLAETLSYDETAAMLKVICDANPIVKKAWIEAVNGPTYDDEDEHSVH